MVPGQIALMRTRRVLEGSASGEADDAVLGAVVGGAARKPDQAAERGAVDDGAAALRAHRPQLVLHAGPDAAEVDGVHAVEGLGLFVGGVGRRSLDAGVVECEVQPAEARHGAFHERGDLLLVGHVAGGTECLTARGGQLVRRGPEGLLIAVGKYDSGPGLGERPCRGEPHAGAGSGDDRDVVVEVVGRVHVASG